MKTKVTLNEDKEFVKEFRQKLKENDGFCPCRLIRAEETRCICKEFKEQIDREELGYCHCRLYQVVENK